MSNENEEPKKRVRLGVMVKPENLDAIKEIKESEELRSEGAVVDHAIETLVSHIERRSHK